MIRSTTAIAAIATAFLTTTAQGVTVEPDSFAAGTDITNATPGLTLTTSGNIVFGTSAGSTFATTPPTGPGVSSTGSLVFGYQNGSQMQTNFSQGFLNATLRGEFTTFASEIMIDAIGNNTSGGSDAGVLRGFDASDNLLAMDTVTGLSRGQVGTLSITSPNADGFAAFTFTGGNNAGSNADNLRFTPVPEPASLALTGLASLTLLRRRRPS